MGMAGDPHISDLFEQLQIVLPNYVGYFGRELRNMSGSDIDYGSAVFVKTTSGEHTYSEFFPYGEEEDRTGKQKMFEYTSRILQTVMFKKLPFAIHNYHGIWTGGGKGDVTARIEQSENINKVMANLPIPQLLCGDLNLWPNTRSLALLTEGRRDLIKESGITSTRSHHYTQENKFADYAIVTNDVKVTTFKVLPDVVSDHLALMLELEM